MDRDVYNIEGAKMTAFRYKPLYYQKNMLYQHRVPWLDAQYRNYFKQDPLFMSAVPCLYHKPLTKRNDGLLEHFTTDGEINNKSKTINIIIIVIICILLFLLFYKR